MKSKRLVCLIITFILILQLGTTVSAATPYANYFISYGGSWTLPTPAAYEYLTTIDFKTTEEGKLNTPQDMFIDKNGKIYIADSKNNRIVVLNPDYTLDFTIGGDSNDPNDEGALLEPSGVFVDDDGTILVADFGNKRLVEFTKYGNFRFSYPTPDSEILGDDFNYQPYKVIKDHRGYIFVASTADYHGLLMLGSDGSFKSYYGANPVALTLWESIARLLWSREDRRSSVVTLPYTFNNIYAGKDKYIYASTTGSATGQVRKINSAGNDVLYGGYDFSDLMIYNSVVGQSGNQLFADVTMDNDGNMLIIDNLYGRIYEYDEWGRNLFVFGTNGNGKGQFADPKAIEVGPDGRVYVLNGRNGTVSVFQTTSFADNVHVANRHYSDGEYDLAYPQWQKVLDQDSYYILALQAMGQIKMREELYSEALQFFYEAEDPTLYSDAYEELRTQFIKDYFPIIATGLVGLVVLLLVLSKILKARRKKRKDIPEKNNAFSKIKAFIRQMKHVAFHPIDGFDEIRYEGKGSYPQAFIIMALYLVSTVLSTMLTGFVFSGVTSLEYYNWNFILLWSVLPWIVIAVVNYGVTTIMYGEGRFRDVVIGGAYCHVPFILTQVPLALVSRVLTTNEASIFNLVQTIIYIWVGLLVYFCIKGVHGFHPVKGAVVFFLTAVGVVAVALLFMIVYGLAIQMFDFIFQFGKELSYLV